MRAPLLGIAIALAAGGCTFVPTYERPVAPVAPAFRGAPDSSTTASGTLATRPASEIDWREFFLDARLRNLVESALANNRDLRVAVLAIERARAQYQIQSADRLPTVNATGQHTDQRVSGSSSPSNVGYRIGFYQAGVGITSYELDFFGRVRALESAALAQYYATEEARRAAQISLVASIANTWLALLADDAQIALARKTIDSREASLRLARLRVQAGVAGELDLRAAESQLAIASAALAQAERQRALDVNALELLVGRPLTDAELATAPDPAGASDSAGDALAVPQILADVPAGLPSELLERRPDIRAAEQQLVAANANIGAARAAFFPRIALTANFGAVSGDLLGLFSAANRTWSFVPSASLPLFDGGRNRAALEVAQANREIAIAQYERAIQVAFREVADALAGRATLGRQLEALRAQARAETERVRVTELRQRGGVASTLELLDAQRALFTAEQAVLQLRLQQLQNQVAVYRALGGGWTPPR